MSKTYVPVALLVRTRAKRLCEYFDSRRTPQVDHIISEKPTTGGQPRLCVQLIASDIGSIVWPEQVARIDMRSRPVFWISIMLTD